MFPERARDGGIRAGSETQSAPSNSSRSRGGGYYLFLGIVSGLLLFFLSFIHVRGAYHFPAAFGFFRRIFYLQYALFAGTLLAAILYFLSGRGGFRAAVRSLALAAFYFLFIWVVLWSMVHRAFGIELTPALMINGVFNAAPISEMGVSASEVAEVLILAAVIILSATFLTNRIAARYLPGVIRKGFVFWAASFLVVHAAVRIYFGYHIVHGDYAVLAYDDCVPFPLRTESLLPGTRSTRLALPNYAEAVRTKTYLAGVRKNEGLTVPNPRNVLFLNVESLRFDAVSNETMPRLSSFAHYFQLRLNENHWSGANATHMSIFSMLTGVSGYYVPAFRYAGVSDPFLDLLAHNGYRIRFGKKAHLQSADLPGLVPSAALSVDVDVSIDRGDPLMIDRYLDDRKSRAGAPAFDFLPLDATHWPYSFDPEDRVSLPVPDLKSSGHELLSSSNLAGVRNRYNDACHCVDRQIGRVLEDLEQRGGFADTIVIVLGDHGEEFQERGQLTHSAVSNDFQGRTILWMHFPDRDETRLSPLEPTTHLDIVPTVLQALGFRQDILYTQGASLLSPLPRRPLLSLAEQGGLSVPLYRCFVSREYISSWRFGSSSYLFCAVQRRDGTPVQGTQWLDEVRQDYQAAARMYDLLPDVTAAPRSFDDTAVAAFRRGQ